MNIAKKILTIGSIVAIAGTILMSVAVNISYAQLGGIAFNGRSEGGRFFVVSKTGDFIEVNGDDWYTSAFMVYALIGLSFFSMAGLSYLFFAYLVPLIRRLNDLILRRK